MNLTDNKLTCLIELKRIDLDLERLRRSSESVIQRMVTSLKNQGQLTPLVLAQTDHQPLLIDGFKRYRAAERLSIKELNVVILDRGQSKIKALVYLLNRTGNFSVIEEALLIRELVEVDGLSQVEAAILLERHKAWVNRRLMLIRQLAPEIVADAQLKLIPPGSLSSLARLPVCNQVDFTAAIQRDGLETQEIQQLVDLFVKTNDPGIRQYLLKNPRQTLARVRDQRKAVKTDIPTIVTRLWSLLDALEKGTVSVPETSLKPETRIEIQTALNAIKTNLSRIQSGLLGACHEKVD